MQHSRLITVYIDFKIGVNLNIYFDVLLTPCLKSSDIIRTILDSINEFISKLNRLNRKSVSTDFSSNYMYEDLLKDQKNYQVQLKIMAPANCQNRSTTSCHILYKSIESSVSAYYLTSVLYDHSEKVLPENFLMANLKPPWLNGKFCLHERVF